LDVRELVLQRNSLPSFHESQRLAVQDLLREYEIDESKANPTPQWIGVFDDVLTVGTHFVAMKRILSTRFPGIRIQGLFIARRVLHDPLEKAPAE
jgi:hypothetical protein